MRRKPYTELGLKRLKCAHCGKPATDQWHTNICSVKLGYFPVCKECDLKLNLDTLEFFRIPNTDDIIKDYRQWYFGEIS